MIALYNEYNSCCRPDIEVGTELLGQSGYNKPSKYEKGLGKGQKEVEGITEKKNKKVRHIRRGWHLL